MLIQAFCQCFHSFYFKRSYTIINISDCMVVLFDSGFWAIFSQMLKHVINNRKLVRQEQYNNLCLISEILV